MGGGGVWCFGCWGEGVSGFCWAGIVGGVDRVDLGGALLGRAIGVPVGRISVGYDSFRFIYSVNDLVGPGR